MGGRQATADERADEPERQTSVARKVFFWKTDSHSRQYNANPQAKSTEEAANKKAFSTLWANIAT